MSERVVIFIDGSNFYFGCVDLIRKAKIDFYKLSQYLSKNRTLIRTYYYNAPLIKEKDEARYKSQQRFFERLKVTPYLELRLGRLVDRNGVLVEKGIDVNIAIDMLTLAWNNVYDTAILISGDGDFTSAVKSVKDKGKHVENAYFKNSQSNALREACDIEIELTSEILLKCSFN
jgi:uncharacterized LabA/DUF88 family protein